MNHLTSVSPFPSYPSNLKIALQTLEDRQRMLQKRSLSGYTPNNSNEQTSASSRLTQSLAKAVIKLGARVTAVETKLDNLTVAMSELTKVIQNQAQRHYHQ
eukprot:m.35961 g.35961  ORF g.35961 m.35961 type:complete len:101 (+) comp6638_c1_seq1:190-492(+)